MYSFFAIGASCAWSMVAPTRFPSHESHEVSFHFCTQRIPKNPQDFCSDSKWRMAGTEPADVRSTSWTLLDGRLLWLGQADWRSGRLTGLTGLTQNVASNSLKSDSTCYAAEVKSHMPLFSSKFSQERSSSSLVKCWRHESDMSNWMQPRTPRTPANAAKPGTI